VTKHPGKTAAQKRALDAIGCGNDSPRMSTATRDGLLRHGLIVEISPRVLPGRLPVHIRQFEMPTPVHIQWCEAVSEETAQ
jgi:hypothetical protein